MFYPSLLPGQELQLKLASWGFIFQRENQEINVSTLLKGTAASRACMYGQYIPVKAVFVAEDSPRSSGAS